LTYVVTILILTGYFIYSKVIFYLVFFITFCPCILYVFIFENGNSASEQRKNVCFII